MNRRNFLKNSALALFGFTVLPPAETYQRIWKAQRQPVIAELTIVINEAYRTVPYEASFLMSQETLDEWKRAILPRTLDISRFKA
jgi:hypothetical protein